MRLSSNIEALTISADRCGILCHALLNPYRVIVARLLNAPRSESGILACYQVEFTDVEVRVKDKEVSSAQQCSDHKTNTQNWPPTLGGLYGNWDPPSLGFCRWNLESGIWNLESGIWNLESGIWNLESGIWNFESGTWNL